MAAGTYRVTVTDIGKDATGKAMGCQVSKDVTVSGPDAEMTVTEEHTDAECFTSDDGTISLSVQGGTKAGTGYYYYKYNNQTWPADMTTWTQSVAASVTPVKIQYDNGGTLQDEWPAAAYLITVRDSNGCEKTVDIKIAQPNPITFSYTTTNVTIKNGANGTISIADVAGGTPAYILEWADTYNGNPANFLPKGSYTDQYTRRNLKAGQYYARVKDSNGCVSDVKVITVSENGALDIEVPEADVKHVDCYGESNGEIVVRVINGQAPYDIYVDDILKVSQFRGGSDVLLTGYPVGQYVIRVVDAAGAYKVSDPVEVKYKGDNVTGPLDFDYTVTYPAGQTAVCYGTKTATIQFSNVTGGSLNADGKYSKYTVAPGAVSVTNFEDNAKVYSSYSQTPDTGTYLFGVGNYVITITDNNGCQVQKTVEVMGMDDITIDNIVVRDVKCNGANDGAITYTVAGGNGVYSFDWKKKGTGVAYDQNVLDMNGKSLNNVQNVSYINGGDYRVTVTSGGCSKDFFFTVTEPANALKVTLVPTNPSCYGLADGQIIANVDGGTAPYTYVWRNAEGTLLGSKTNLQTGLADGTYSVTVTDANGCTSGAVSQTLIQPKTYYLAILEDISCDGTHAKLGILSDPKDKTSVIDPLGTLGYNVTWSGANLTSDQIDSGKDRGTLTLDGTVERPVNGTVTMTMKKTGACDITGEVTLVKPLTATFVKEDPTCDGVNNGTITLKVSGGSGKYNYHWCQYVDDDTANDTVAGSAVSGLAMRSGLAKGSYFFTVEDLVARDIDGDGAEDATCLTTETKVDLVSANGFDVKEEHKDVTCFSEQNGLISINVLNGSGDYSFVWSGTGSGIVNNTNVQSGLSAGVYTVVVRDRQWGCTSKKAVTINGPTADLVVRAQVEQNVTCNGGTDGKFVISITGGVAPYYYSIDNANVPTIPAGSTGSNEISQAEADSVTFSSEADGHGFDGKAGRHLVYVQDANGCLSIVEVNVTEPEPVEFTYEAVNPTTNDGKDGKITITGITGGNAPYTIKWEKANGSGTFYDITGTTEGSTNVSGSTRILNGLGNNIYRITAVDANGCVSAQKIVVITDKGALDVDFDKTDALCYGANGQLTALIVNGTAPYDIYVNEVPYQTGFMGGAQIVVDRPAGDYTIRVTDAKGGSVTSEVLKINQPSNPLTFTVTETDVQCYGSNNGTLKVQVTGGTAMTDAAKRYEVVMANTGIHYSIDNTGIYNITGYAPGEYTLTATDANGCAVTKTATITEYPEITLSNDVTGVTCNGSSNASIDLTVHGGIGPFAFRWNKYNDATSNVVVDSAEYPGDIVEDPVNLAGGYYKVIVEDKGTSTDPALTCKVTSDIIYVPEPQEITITETLHTNVTCNGAADGKISVTVRGGTTPYTYAWATADGTALASTTNALNDLEPGIYMITVTDAHGCQKVEYYKITEPLAFETVLTDYPDCDGRNGKAEIRALGSSVAFDNSDVDYGGYNISWRGPNGTNTSASDQTTASNLTSGSYTVTMTKSQACTVTMSVAVPKVMNVTYDVKPQTCAGINDGEITLDVTGGSGNFSYMWSGTNVNNNNGGHQVKLQEGTYTVVVTDNKTGCTHPATGSDALSIVVPSAYDFHVDAAVSDVSCFGNIDGAVSLTVVNGSGNYTFEWSGTGVGIVDGVEDQTALSKGSYTVVVTDNVLGCAATKSNLMVGSPDFALTAVTTAHSDILCADATTNDGSITIKISGGTPKLDNTGNYYSVSVNGGREHRDPT